MTFEQHIAAANAECDRIEAALWDRYPSIQKRQDLPLELMTGEERANYLAIKNTLEEMCKQLSRLRSPHAARRMMFRTVVASHFPPRAVATP
jgi:hypothetical protein